MEHANDIDDWGYPHFRKLPFLLHEGVTNPWYTKSKPGDWIPTLQVEALQGSKFPDFRASRIQKLQGSTVPRFQVSVLIP